jgi:hypothetical protein
VLDCYDLSDTRRESVLLSFRESVLRALGPAVEGLRRATGVELDPYGTTRLYPNQIETFLKLAAECPTPDGDPGEELMRLIAFLTLRVRAQAGLLIEGD